MKTFTLIVRYLLGLVFLVFGLNYFFGFIAMPAPAPKAGEFMGALMATGYFFPLLKVVEITAAAMLLLNFMAPLALVLLAPIVIHILFFHLFLAVAGLPLAIFLVAAELYLAFAYRESFRGLLSVSHEKKEDDYMRHAGSHVVGI